MVLLFFLVPVLVIGFVIFAFAVAKPAAGVAVAMAVPMEKTGFFFLKQELAKHGVAAMVPDACVAELVGHAIQISTSLANIRGGPVQAHLSEFLEGTAVNVVIALMPPAQRKRERHLLDEDVYAIVSKYVRVPA